MSKTKSIPYSLGEYLAKYIIDHHMPSLSCNIWTKKVIQVTWGEAKEYRRLSDAWFRKLHSYKKDIIARGKQAFKEEQKAYKYAKDEWNEYIKYSYTLKEKYLPHTLKCIVPFIDLSDEETNKEIKKGLIACLWDCDHCEYSLKEEDVLFEQEIFKYGSNNKYSITNTYVILKLCLEPPSSYTGDDWIDVKTPQDEK